LRTIPDELVKRYTAEGWWTGDTMGDLLSRGLAEHPDAVFRVHSAARPFTGTFRDVDLTARRLAAGLRERGVGPGDVIAMQLPNWMEAAATFWAAAMLGAVMVPIVHFYGRKEVSYILSSVKPSVFITAAEFGRLRYDPAVSADVPVVGVVGVVGSGERDFDALLAETPLEGVLAADPASTALIAFTSGTTRNPKGVIHSHRTLGFETRQSLDRYPGNRGTPLSSAPVGHFIGMLGALLTPVALGRDIHIADTWDPGLVLSLMESEGLSVGGGAPYYVTSLLDHPDFTPGHLKSMKYAGFGGAPVPAPFLERLTELGIVAYRSYGSTEHPSVTGSVYSAPAAKRLYTDGEALPGVEVRLSEEGEILSRGPDLCLGYTDPALTAATFDDEGWYHTGDLASVDADGYYTITGRKADLIIRGGENVSAVEVESLLLTLDGVAEVAVVAAPDPRLGEHGAAVFRMREPGAPAPSLAEVRTHLEAAGLARQKWPEEIRSVGDLGRDDFPRTPSGKIQKYVLRQAIADRSR